MAKHNFFTKYNKSQEQIFLSVEESVKFVDANDLARLNKKTTYKGIPKYDYKTINVFPFSVEIDFTMNANYTEAEKKRILVPKWIKNETVSFITISERISGKHGFKHTSVWNGSALEHNKIVSKQSGLAGRTGWLYYAATDAEVISFFESRGYTTITNSKNQINRVSFTKDINSEEEGNQMMEDVYDFDKQFKKK